MAELIERIVPPGSGGIIELQIKNETRAHRTESEKARPSGTREALIGLHFLPEDNNIAGFISSVSRPVNHVIESDFSMIVFIVMDNIIGIAENTDMTKTSDIIETDGTLTIDDGGISGSGFASVNIFSSDFSTSNYTANGMKMSQRQIA